VAPPAGVRKIGLLMNSRKNMKDINEMPERQRCKCPCGYLFYADLYKSASFLGLVFKDSQKIRLQSTVCPKCRKKLALDDNPLILE
jgi:hypothetical protein